MPDRPPWLTDEVVQDLLEWKRVHDQAHPPFAVSREQFLACYRECYLNRPATKRELEKGMKLAAAEVGKLWSQDASHLAYKVAAAEVEQGEAYSDWKMRDLDDICVPFRR